MSTMLESRLGELALTLADLQRQFRSAARLEVGRAVGEALRQFALATICGPVAADRSRYADVEDPWDAPEDWDPRELETSVDGATHRAEGASQLQAAVLLGLGGARWTFQRTRNPAVAIATGLALVAFALLGGPTADSVLRAWMSAKNLLHGDSLAV